MTSKGCIGKPQHMSRDLGNCMYLKAPEVEIFTDPYSAGCINTCKCHSGTLVFTPWADMTNAGKKFHIILDQSKNTCRLVLLTNLLFQVWQFPAFSGCLAVYCKLKCSCMNTSLISYWREGASETSQDDLPQQQGDGFSFRPDGMTVVCYLIWIYAATVNKPGRGWDFDLLWLVLSDGC